MAIKMRVLCYPEKKKLLAIGNERRTRRGYEHDVNRKHGGKEYDDFKNNIYEYDYNNVHCH